MSWHPSNFPCPMCKNYFGKNPNCPLCVRHTFNLQHGKQFDELDPTPPHYHVCTCGRVDMHNHWERVLGFIPLPLQGNAWCRVCGEYMGTSDL